MNTPSQTPFATQNHHLDLRVALQRDIADRLIANVEQLLAAARPRFL